MESLKLIAADIDGTLVNEERQLTDRTRRVLCEYHDHGILVGFASGRPLIQQRSRMIAWRLPFEPDFLIGYSGGELYDGIDGTQESFHKLSPETMKEIIELMKPFLDRVTMQVYIDDYIQGTRADHYSLRAAKRSDIRLVLTEDLSRYCDRAFHNVLFRIPDEKDIPAVDAYLREHPSGHFQHFKTQPQLIEFQDPRVNKGDALRMFMECHHIPVSSSVAFGDLSNDLPLLKAAGVGVCMKNGSADVKAAADEITEFTNDEDGLALHLLSRYPLQKTAL